MFTETDVQIIIIWLLTRDWDEQAVNAHTARSNYGCNPNQMTNYPIVSAAAAMFSPSVGQ